MDDMSEYKKIYAIESAEHLQTMNDALLYLEKDPHNNDTVNTMFRAAHTLKSMSATMGFSNIAELTHKMENLMDRVRKNEMKLDDEAIEVLFECLDILEGMSEIPENSMQCDISPLIQKIQLMISKDEGTKEPKKEPEEAKKTPDTIIPEKAVTSSNVFDVAVTLDGTCSLKSARSAIVLRNLSELGKIIGTNPSEQDLDAEKFEREFVVTVSTNEEAAKLEDAVRKIYEISKVEVKLAQPSEKTHKEEKKPEAAPVIDSPDKTRASCNVFNVTVALDESCNLKSARSAIVLRNLSELGKIIGTSPSEDELDAGRFDGEFMVTVSTTEEAKKIEEAVEKIYEVSRVEVKPAHIAEQITMLKEKKIEKEKSASKNLQSVRVSIERLDSMMNLVGELIINKIRLVQLASDYDLKAMDEALAALDRLTSELQDQVMASRMVPLEQIFNRFPRMVRDLTKIENKKIELLMTGADIELDRTVLDEIGDPLVHLLRNCVDHGIESPETREKCGKNPLGTIRLTARREKSYVAIEVEDDGKGMDPVKFREIAVKKGIISQEEASKLSDVEALSLSYLPGFTSAEKVTEISGRGVGLDVVRTKIEGMGGSVKLETKVGSGTRITLKLPLTVAIINSQMVKVGENIYAIPISNVVRDVSIKKEMIQTLQSEEIVMIRDEVLPLVWLPKLFGVSSRVKDDLIVVVVERMGSNIGLVVDQLIGQQEVIIKNLDSRLLKGIKGFAGATILGDGNVALIIDVGTLL